ncbi:MAG: hypothetical protein IJW46_01560 [Clostridia bacterium]|nr:hypothetical protein [Clostridia bacterium]
MKSLKKALAIVFALLMISASIVTLSSCGKVTSDNPGAIINVYMPYSVSLDPATAYADDASSKLLSLVYEGLTYIDAKGKLKGAVADEWEIYTDRDGNQVIDIKLKTTRWSDGTNVDAEDFLDSWERILDPAFNCEAASLLFPIQNAIAVKRGEMTLSDLGIRASSQDTLTVILEDWADPEAFLRNCASVALYPIRKDVINKIYDRDSGKENDWSTVIAIMQTNGPFFLKGVSFGSIQEGVSSRPYLVLERNTNYYLDPEKNESLDKYVVPYRIHVNMTYGNDDVANFVNKKYDEVAAAYYKQHKSQILDDTVAEMRAAMTDEEYAALGAKPADVLKERALAKIKDDIAKEYSLDYATQVLETIRVNKDYFYSEYNAGNVLYNSSLPQSEDVQDVEKVNSMMTGAFYFNTKNEILDDAKVRQALSLALDREAIATLAKNGKAASTIITEGVFETDRKTSFKANSSSYAISTTGDLAAAKSLLQSAGVSSGSFMITVRPTEADVLIAQYAAEVWGELGFTVGIRVCGYNITTYTERQLVATDKKDENGKSIKEWQDVIIYDGLLHDTYLDAYNASDFDVILCDMNMLSTDAFPVLAQFAGIYSCRAYDFTDVSNFDKLVVGVTGYYNEAYDTLMTQALQEKDAAKRAQLLHQAEEMILEDMPVTPIIHYENTFIVSDELDDVDTNYFGASVFTETSYDNYVAEIEEEAVETTVAPSTEAAPSEE